MRPDNKTAASPWHWTLQRLWNGDFFFNWILVLHLTVCLAQIKRYKSTEQN